MPDGAGTPGAGQGRTVLFEHRRLGDWVRVAAVDAQTGEEAVATGPADAATLVERLAAAKLARRLAGGSGSGGAAF